MRSEEQRKAAYNAGYNDVKTELASTQAQPYNTLTGSAVVSQGNAILNRIQGAIKTGGLPNTAGMRLLADNVDRVISTLHAIESEMTDNAFDVSEEDLNGASESAPDTVSAEENAAAGEPSFSQKWQSYELSDEFMREVPSVDRHSFLRSLANKTKGIKKGEKRHVPIITENHLYLFYADGYMTGYIEEKINIDTDAERARKLWKEYKQDAHTNSKAADRWTRAVPGIRRESGGDISVPVQKRSTNEGNDKVSSAERAGNRGRDNGEVVSDIEEDVREYAPGTVYFDGKNGYIVKEDGTHERFDLENDEEKQQFSTKLDVSYLAAVDRGDMETAQRMVDEAAKAAGYTVKAYHGTPNGTFTVFHDWSYFTANKQYADIYQNQGASSNGYKKTADNPKTYGVYINPQNVFDTRNAGDRKIFENEFLGKWGNNTPLSDRGLPDWTDAEDLIEFFEENGYDYDAIYLDEGGTGGYGDKVNDRGVSILVRKSSQIKSADPVTYDDNGNVIPLSERFNQEKNDIRNSQAFDPKALQDLVEQYGQIKEGEEPRARDVAYRKIYADIGRQMPASFMDRWNAWRYLALLLNAFAAFHLTFAVVNEGDLWYTLSEEKRGFTWQNTAREMKSKRSTAGRWRTSMPTRRHGTRTSGNWRSWRRPFRATGADSARAPGRFSNT